MVELNELLELQKYQKHIKNFHCKDCIHFGRISRYYFYCNTRKSFYTQNLKLRIKAGDVACPLYKNQSTFKANNNPANLL